MFAHNCAAAHMRCYAELGCGSTSRGADNGMCSQAPSPTGPCLQSSPASTAAPCSTHLRARLSGGSYTLAGCLLHSWSSCAAAACRSGGAAAQVLSCMPVVPARSAHSAMLHAHLPVLLPLTCAGLQGLPIRQVAGTEVRPPSTTLTLPLRLARPPTDNLSPRPQPAKHPLGVALQHRLPSNAPQCDSRVSHLLFPEASHATASTNSIAASQNFFWFD